MFNDEIKQLVCTRVTKALQDLDVLYGVEVKAVKFIEDTCYVWVNMMESASTTINGRHANHYVMVDHIIELIQPVLDRISITARIPIIPWKLQTSVYRGVFMVHSVDQVVNQPQDAENRCPAWTDEEGGLVEP